MKPGKVILKLCQFAVTLPRFYQWVNRGLFLGGLFLVFVTTKFFLEKKVAKNQCSGEKKLFKDFFWE